MKTTEFNYELLTDLLTDISVFLENTDSHAKVVSITITPFKKRFIAILTQNK